MKFLLLAGLLLMIGGVTALFAVVTGLIGGGVRVALLGFVATLAGLMAGTAGAAGLLKPPHRN